MGKKLWLPLMWISWNEKTFKHLKNTEAPTNTQTRTNSQNQVWGKQCGTDGICCDKFQNTFNRTAHIDWLKIKRWGKSASTCCTSTTTTTKKASPLLFDLFFYCEKIKNQIAELHNLSHCRFLWRAKKKHWCEFVEKIKIKCFC